MIPANKTIKQNGLARWIKWWFPMLSILGIILHATGLLSPIIEPDGALYASISKTMVERGDAVNLIADGNDWLDKPHFPFWLTALSFYFFGFNSFAYKLPGLLFMLMGAWYTYRFTKIIYNKPTAQLAVLIYLSAEHLLLCSTDVRAEPYLTGLIIASVYHLYRAGEKRYSRHIIWGALYAAFAVMTKGIFVLITIGGGFVLQWIIRKQWKEFFQPRWWIALLLVFIFIIPELYCLYSQFDLHPEKLVFGKTGVSGIRFFFWDSQFGRFFNTGPIKGKGDLLFYIHTLLWAFLPWSLLFYASVVWLIRKSIGKTAVLKEWVTVGASGIGFILFSVSKFQLPHYIVILFPFFATLCARYLFLLEDRKEIRRVVILQNIICIVLVLLVPLLAWYYHRLSLIAVAVWVLGMVLGGLYLFPRRSLTAAIGRSFWTIVLVNGFLNLLFYPSLLDYQSGMIAARWFNQYQAIQKKPALLMCNSNSFEFYLRQPVLRLSLTDLKSRNDPSLVVFMPADSLTEITKTGLQYRLLKPFDHFPVTRLNGDFINHSSRAGTLTGYVLAQIE
jgi:4-amino-4-deoxy-L-arabinose transferase-like glycosyltransferase